MLIIINGILKWHALHYILVRGLLRVPFIFVRSIDNELIQNRRAIANKFNEYFVSFAVNLNKAAENDFGMLIKTLPTVETYLTKPCENAIFIDECNEKEIVKITSEFANGKTSDIPTQNYQEGCSGISEISQTFV